MRGKNILLSAVLTVFFVTLPFFGSAHASGEFTLSRNVVDGARVTDTNEELSNSGNFWFADYTIEPYSEYYHPTFRMNYTSKFAINGVQIPMDFVSGNDYQNGQSNSYTETDQAGQELFLSPLMFGTNQKIRPVLINRYWWTNVWEGKSLQFLYNTENRKYAYFPLNDVMFISPGNNDVVVLHDAG